VNGWSVGRYTYIYIYTGAITNKYVAFNHGICQCVCNCDLNLNGFGVVFVVFIFCILFGFLIDLF